MSKFHQCLTVPTNLFLKNHDTAVELCRITIQSLCQNPWIKRRSQVNNFYGMLASEEGQNCPKIYKQGFAFQQIHLVTLICHYHLTLTIRNLPRCELGITKRNIQKITIINVDTAYSVERKYKFHSAHHLAISVHNSVFY